MIDSTRHESVFSPHDWGERRVDIIGVGATGSKVALSLAKLGVRNLHVWDFDIVEEHNLANQAYGLEHIGQAKTDSIHDLIKQATGLEVRTHHRGWKPGDPVGEVVFALVDSMLVRRQIFDAYRWSPHVSLVVDTRMGSDTGYVMCYRPGSPDTRRYEQTLYSDDDAITEVSACGTAITVGPTADIIAGYAVWQFIKHAASLADPVHHYDPELAIGARHPALNVL